LLSPEPPAETDFGCKSDAECPAKEACFARERECDNPCVRNKPCAENADCFVHNSVPRTLSCICKEGFTGTGDVRCEKIGELTNSSYLKTFRSYIEIVAVAPLLVGCSNNDECAPNLACTNKGCVDPCASDPCSPRALCTVDYHKHVCKCPPGFTGDAYFGACVPIKKGECDHDHECPDDKACYDHQCRSPCSPPGHRGRVCGTNAECYATLHRAVCQCPLGWAGNPHETCYQRKHLFHHNTFYILSINSFLLADQCLIDPDCPTNKACVKNECVNPCTSTTCGERATCSVDYHRARCTCPPGLQGNPLERCVEAGCQSNDDCRDDEQCDYSSGRCQQLCQPGPCLSNARCKARGHREHCECPSPNKGDGRVVCEKRK